MIRSIELWAHARVFCLRPCFRFVSTFKIYDFYSASKHMIRIRLFYDFQYSGQLSTTIRIAHSNFPCFEHFIARTTFRTIFIQINRIRTVFIQITTSLRGKLRALVWVCLNVLDIEDIVIVVFYILWQCCDSNSEQQALLFWTICRKTVVRIISIRIVFEQWLFKLQLRVGKNCVLVWVSCAYACGFNAFNIEDIMLIFYIFDMAMLWFE